LDADHTPDDAERSETRSPGSARQIVAAVLLLAALVGTGLFLTGALRNAGRIQDCVASGRTNCAPIH
jgi:hypothetical protein